MSRVNHKANVTIRMKGLGLGHYNEKTKNWEFIFLRGIPNHNLKIIVREYRNGLTSPVEHTYPIPVDSKKITITTKGAEAQHSHYTTDNFAHRVRVDDSRDAKWMVDLSDETLHNAPIKLKKASERTDNPVDLTYLSIADAMLYADTIFDRPYQIVKNNNQPLPPRVMGEWLGLDIEWNKKDSKTDIKFESKPKILSDIPLVNDKNVSIYEIEINNDCCGGGQPGVSDFHYYYDYLVDMPDKFDENVVPTKPAMTESALHFKTLFNSVSFSDDSCKDVDCCAKLCSQLDGIDSLEELL